MAYWALKTRESHNNRQDMSEDHWHDFVKNNVVAIGWILPRISPEKVSKDQLITALKNTYHYSNQAAISNAATIRKFIALNEGDYILICQGYTPNQNNNKSVRLYGTAKITGTFKNNLASTWWHYQYDAHVQPFANQGDKEIPKALLVKKLGNKSLMLTLHKITKEGYESVVEWARH